MLGSGEGGGAGMSGREGIDGIVIDEVGSVIEVAKAVGGYIWPRGKAGTLAALPWNPVSGQAAPTSAGSVARLALLMSPLAASIFLRYRVASFI